jgi:hypothetical protein
MSMAKRLIVGILVLGFMVTGGWAAGRVLATEQDGERSDRDRRDRDHGDRDRSDFALFDGTNPATEAPPNGGAECYVKNGFGATLHVTVTAHSSGPDGVVRATFKDGDWVEFPVKSGGSFDFSQSIGGSPGVDDRIRISNGGKAGGARLVGWASIQSDGVVSCRSCNFDDGAGGTGCQNNP